MPAAAPLAVSCVDQSRNSRSNVVWELYGEVLHAVPVEVRGAIMYCLADDDVDGAWMTLTSAAEQGPASLYSSGLLLAGIAGLSQWEHVSYSVLAIGGPGCWSAPAAPWSWFSILFFLRWFRCCFFVVA